MATWDFYEDSSLTNAYTAFSLTATGAVFPVYFGSTTTGRKVVSTTTGGQLSIGFSDSATGSGHAVTAGRLSATTGGLAGASWGASLNIGTYVNGGSTNAWSGYLELRDEVGDGVYSAELALVLSAAKEQAVT